MTAQLGSLRRPAVAGLLIGVLLVGIWFEVLWKPQSAALAAAHRRDQQATSDLFTAEQNLGHLKHLATSESQLKALGDTLASAVPASDDLDTFLLELNATASTTGVKLTSVAPGAESSSSGGVAIIPFGVTLNGGYFQVQSFLDALRNGSRLVVIDDVIESPSSTNVITASITAHLLTGLVSTVPVPHPVTASASSSKAPSGVISGPVSRATSAVNAANANTAAIQGATR